MQIDEILNKVLEANPNADLSEIRSAITSLENEATQNALNALNASNAQKSAVNELNDIKAQLADLRAAFGLNNDSSLKEQLSAIIASKGKAEAAELNALKAQIIELKEAAAQDKIKAQKLAKQNALNEIVANIENLNPLFKEDVALRLQSILKLDESGRAYFEIDGNPIAKDAYLRDFVRNNQKYLNPIGNVGAGNGGGYNSAGAAINKADFEKMSATQKIQLYKSDPELYNALAN